MSSPSELTLNLTNPCHFTIIPLSSPQNDYNGLQTLNNSSQFPSHCIMLVNCHSKGKLHRPRIPLVSCSSLHMGLCLSAQLSSAGRWSCARLIPFFVPWTSAQFPSHSVSCFIHLKCLLQIFMCWLSSYNWTWPQRSLPDHLTQRKPHLPYHDVLYFSIWFPSIFKSLQPLYYPIWMFHVWSTSSLRQWLWCFWFSVPKYFICIWYLANIHWLTD